MDQDITSALKAIERKPDDPLPVLILADRLDELGFGVAAGVLRKKAWVWMPHPAHLIVARDCRFHLATWVGHYIVSTVGEYFPSESVREIMASSRGITLTGRGDAREADFRQQVGFVEIGAGRIYETMVFACDRQPTKEEEKCGCLYKPTVWSEVDFSGYNDPEKAVKGHTRMCDKWSREKKYEQPADG